MAKITQVVCDFDGKTKFQPEDGFVDFTFQVAGKRWEIDLSAKGKAAFDATQAEVREIRAEAEKRAAELMSRFVDKARPAPLTADEKMRKTKIFYNEVRAWCDKNGVKYNRSGKLAEEFIARWERDTKQQRPEYVPHP